MINSFGPGNQKKPPKPPNSKGVKKNINPLTNTPVGGTPAANPMGGAQMDFDMGDMSGMGGMQMNAPSPTGGGDGGYENFMMGMTAINGEQPSGANVIKSPEGPTTAGGWRKELPGVAGMSSMGAQPTGMAGFSGAQSPQVAGWNDPAMGGFQMDTPMMNDPMMGGMQMGQPDMGQPFMGDPVMGQLQGPAGQQPPPANPPIPKGKKGWIRPPWSDEEYQKRYEALPGMIPTPDDRFGGMSYNDQWEIYQKQLAAQEKILDEINAPKPQDKKPKPRPTIPGRSSFSGGQAPAGGDALGDALSGGSQAVSSVAPPVSQAPPILDPPVSEVAPTVSMPPAGVKNWKGDDTPFEPSRRKPYMPPNQGPAGGPAGAKLYVPPSEYPAGALRADGVMPEVSPEKRALIKQLEDEGAFTDGQGNVIPYHDDVGQHMDVLKKAMESKDSGQDKPALEEFKDKVDAGEVSDEEPALKPWEQPFVSPKDKPEPADKKPPHKTGEFPHVGNMDSDLVEKHYNEHGEMPVPFDDTPGGPQASSPVKPFAGVGDAAYGDADTGSDSKEDIMKPENWDTSGGQYTYKGAEFGASNTNPPADTDDWANTRQEAASASSSAANEPELGPDGLPWGSGMSDKSSVETPYPDRPDRREGYNPDDWERGPLTGSGASSWDNKKTGESWSDPSVYGNQAAEPAQPKAPLVSLPPTQPPPVEKPSADSEYYDKLVNPDKFQNPIIPDLPAGYGSQRVEGGGEYHEFPGREYDVKPEEIFDEYGEPLMGSQGIDSNAGGMTVADVRRRGTTPAQVQALVNNEVANTYQQANQGLGAMTGARPGMSGDIGSYAQQALGPEVAARMAAGQAQVDIPWQYAMQHADQVRQRRDLAHKLGINEAGMIRDDYYDYLGDKMGYADTDNRIMQQMYGEMPDAFG